MMIAIQAFGYSSYESWLSTPLLFVYWKDTMLEDKLLILSQKNWNSPTREQNYDLLPVEHEVGEDNVRQNIQTAIQLFSLHKL